jgi:hypothetical protein
MYCSIHFTNQYSDFWDILYGDYSADWKLWFDTHHGYKLYSLSLLDRPLGQPSFQPSEYHRLFRQGEATTA